MKERKVVAEKVFVFPNPITSMLAAVFMILGLKTGNWVYFLMTVIMVLISTLIPLNVHITLEKKGE